MKYKSKNFAGWMLKRSHRKRSRYAGLDFGRADSKNHRCIEDIPGIDEEILKYRKFKRLKEDVAFKKMSAASSFAMDSKLYFSCV